jgi:hypothetical protein
MGRLIVGVSSSEAQQVQVALNRARPPGHQKLPEDGMATDELLDAIRAFQKHCGLQRNGQPDGPTMKALALEASSEPMELQITLRGRTYVMSKRQYRQLVDRTIRALRYKGPAGDIAASAHEFRAFWNDMNRNNRHSPIVSYLIESTRGVSLPPESVVNRAEAAATQVEAALKSKDLKAIYAAMRRAEPIMNTTRKTLYAYRKEVVQGGQNWISGLTFTKNASFLAVGIMAIPVTASFGAGAVASGAIAAAGTAAVESLANEVGHGFAGSSQGVATATTNVLRDTIIAGALGAFTGGKFAEKIVAGVGAQIARRLTANWITRISQRTATQFITKMLKGGMSNAFEGALSDVIKQLKSRPETLTWEKFMQSVAINLVSGGLFSKLDDVLDPAARNLASNVPPKALRELSQGLGQNLTARDLEKLLTAAGNSTIQGSFNSAVEAVLSRAKGSEKPEVLRTRVMERMYDRKLINRLVNLQKAKNIIR